MSQRSRRISIKYLIATSLALLLAFNIVFAPVNAGEKSSKVQGIEHEIVTRLVRGKEVDSLVRQLTPRSRNAARYQAETTARETERSLALLRQRLGTFIRKGKVNTDDVASLLASFDEFKAYHLLLNAHFESTRARLEQNEAGSDYYRRLEDTKHAYNTLSVRCWRSMNRCSV